MKIHAPQITGSFIGNISGSSTSTGSFGHVKLGDYTAPRTLEITAGNNQDAEIRLHNTNNTIENITENLNLVLEKMILKKPEQWIWSHNRWK